MENIPSKIGKYQIESLLGAGGMGIVYKAIDPDIPDAAKVAVKLIRPELLHDGKNSELLKRFRNEVIACRRLKHPNIVATYAYHEVGDLCFIVMEYVPGKQLSDVLDAHNVFEMEKSIDIMKQLLSALACAHEQGVTHRDIKPSNIMINDKGIIHVADFGIAKLDTSDLTVTGAIMGSPGYMSPEQCLGKPVDNRSDIFSAGVILYQLMTGEKPFAAENPMSTLQKILNTEPIKPTLINNSLSSAFDAVIYKALAKNPKDRFQTAEEFSDAIFKAHKGGSKIKGSYAKVLAYIKYAAVILLLGVLSVLAIINKDIIFPSDSETGPPVVAALNPPEELPDPKIDIIETPAVNLNQVTSLLDNTECSALDANLDSDGKFFVSGFVNSDQLAGLQSQLEGLVGKSGFEISVKPLESPYCAGISLLYPYIKLNQAQNNGVKIGPYQHSKSYVEGEIIKLEVVAPEYDVYFYADYFQSDGSVLHLYPVNELENTLNNGKGLLVLGDGENKWEVYPPFGTDLISVIASEKPLFKSVREQFENAKDYLSALRETLDKSDKDSIIADYFYLKTGPVPE